MRIEYEAKFITEEFRTRLAHNKHNSGGISKKPSLAIHFPLFRDTIDMLTSREIDDLRTPRILRRRPRKSAINYIVRFPQP